MTNPDLHVVVMTCLEPWFLDAVESVNNQELQPEGKHLLIDERFLDKTQEARLNSAKAALSGWTINIHSLDDDFAKHKNWMLNKLPKKEEWVFILDADETIHKSFVSAVKQVTSYSDEYSQTKIDAYSLAMIHTFDGRGGDLTIDWLDPRTPYYPDWHLRLFRNSKNTFFVGLVHEMVTGWKIVAANSDPKLTILHRKTLEMQGVSNKRWRRLDALRREKDPGYLGHIQGEDWEKFINEFED
jgi:hypothetical protein